MDECRLVPICNRINVPRKFRVTVNQHGVVYLMCKCDHTYSTLATVTKNKSTSELLCTFSMHTSSGMLKAKKSTLMFVLQCRDLLSQHCGTGFYCNPLFIRTVCCMNQLPFLTYKSRFTVLQDGVSVVAIVAGHLEIQH